ncbi:RidA family protein [Pseudomonas sp. NPDC089918]|uniref:RidA family protein n=1 Tax=Pseudomonas sp. NPDC089918 TaxID=3390654 RepID=UPI003D02D24A
MDEVLRRIDELGLALPGPNIKGGNYTPFTIHGDLLFVAGQVCLRDNILQYKGTVGVDLSMKEAQDAASICALNLLAIVNQACNGDFSKVRVLKVNGFIKCLPAFEQQAKVLDGASDLLVSVFGEERGKHARAAIGVTALPRGAPVEVEAVFALR